MKRRIFVSLALVSSVACGGGSDLDLQEFAACGGELSGTDWNLTEASLTRSPNEVVENCTVGFDFSISSASGAWSFDASGEYEEMVSLRGISESVFSAGCFDNLEEQCENPLFDEENPSEVCVRNADGGCTCTDSSFENDVSETGDWVTQGNTLSQDDRLDSEYCVDGDQLLLRRTIDNSVAVYRLNRSN